MRNALVFALIIFCSLAASKSYSQGYSGTIYFRDGRSVAFNHLGDIGKISDYTIYGKMGMQNVKYNLGDIKEIIFADKTKEYGGGVNSGSAMIVSKTDKRFTIDECAILWKKDSRNHGRGEFYYVYNDPVTSKVTAARQSIYGSIYRVTIGSESGKSKINNKTGEYFPPFYNFDPFTGDRLVWAPRK